MHDVLYGKYDGIFRACANSVYQASPRGRGLGMRLKTDPLLSKQKSAIIPTFIVTAKDYIKTEHDINF